MKGGRVALLQQKILELEAEVLQAVVPITLAAEPVNELDAARAQKVLDKQPRRRRRRRRARGPITAASVQDVERARKALKLKGMLKP